MQNWLNYHHLFYFKVIAETGSIARASEVLRVGQSALSMQLKVLEESLQKPLFERRQKKLVLTPAGQLALDYARQIFLLGNEMLDTFSDGEQKEKTRIQIGIEEGVPHHISTQILIQALDYPGAAPSVTHGATDLLLQDLLEHRLDLIVQLAPSHPVDKSILLQHCVHTTPLYAVAHPDWSDLKENFPQSLNNKPLLMNSPLSRPRHEVERFFQEHGLNLHLILESDENTILKSLAVQGKGIAFLTEETVKHLVQEKELVILGMLPVKVEIWLIGGKRKVQNPIAQKLLQDFAVSSI